MARLVLVSLPASTVIGWKCASASPEGERLLQYYTIALFVVNEIGQLGKKRLAVETAPTGGCAATKPVRSGFPAPGMRSDSLVAPASVPASAARTRTPAFRGHVRPREPFAARDGGATSKRA